jgi:aminoacylase
LQGFVHSCKVSFIHHVDFRVFVVFVTHVHTEIGGGGMSCFLESQVYKNLPNGFALALDEGLASESDTYAVFYGERLPWWVDVTATGPTGHGSRFIDHTAVEQLVALANKALAFRQGQRRALMGGDDDAAKHANCSHAVARGKKKTTLGDVTSLNITTLQAGVPVGNTFAYNCVPPVAKCSLDIRISPHVAPATIGAMLDQWCQECSSRNNDNSDAASDDNKNNNSKNGAGGSTLTWSFLGDQGNPTNAMQDHSTTSTNVQQNPWYGVFCEAMAEQQLSIDPQVFPAATDSRFLRALGIRALGFSPMKNTEIMLHENDEYIPEQVYIDGIQVYTGLLYKLASQTKEIDQLAASAVLQSNNNGTTTNGHDYVNIDTT